MKKTILYFFRFSPRLWWGILGLTLLASFFESLHVAAFFPVFQSLLTVNGGTIGGSGGFLKFLTAAVSVLPFRDPIVSALVFVIGVTLIKCGTVLLKETLVAIGCGSVQDEIKNRLMAHYAASSYPFFLDHKQGTLLYNLSTGSARVGVLMQKMTQLLADSLKVVAIGLLLLMTVPQATVALSVIALAYQRLTHTLSKNISYHTGRGRVVSGAEQTSIANEFLTGIHQIITFSTASTWLRRFRQQSERFKNLYIQDAVWLSVPRALLEIISVSVLFGFILFFRVHNPMVLSQNLPLLGLFAMALMRLLPSLTSVGQLWMEVSSLQGDAETVEHALTQPILRRTGGSRIFTSLHRGIVFDQVTFAHPNREVLLKEFSVTFDKGKVTAIVGPSGSGKTTVANLILGLVEPTRGRILIDGVGLQEYRLEAWRTRIGFVAQDPFTYHASVTENITFGREGFSPEAIQRAAKVSNADSFIQELPQGYETLIGERGMKLSGGQQQRIAIARAILDDPEILIFDEATSSLDQKSEKLVQEAIEKISHDRTVILIAHRLSTVRYADKIVVLDQGRILEEGNHEELLREQGRYFQLVASTQE